jgi:acylaminoacyl-peptidase
LYYNRSTRWNPQIYAAAGYVTVAINPHGSTGYGQAFCDAIRKNWGSYPYHDLDKGLTYVIENFDFVDADNVVALGASYGGYMINWINGHSRRFKALVNHDGMFSTINSFYTTDELYFPEREVRKQIFGSVCTYWNAKKISFS